MSALHSVAATNAFGTWASIQKKQKKQRGHHFAAMVNRRADALPRYCQRRPTRGLTGKARYRRMLAAYETMRVDGRIPASWEVVGAHALGPPIGQPRRVPGGEIASFSIDSLRGSRRK